MAIERRAPGSPRGAGQFHAIESETFLHRFLSLVAKQGRIIHLFANPDNGKYNPLIFAISVLTRYFSATVIGKTGSGQIQVDSLQTQPVIRAALLKMDRQDFANISNSPIQKNGGL